MQMITYCKLAKLVPISKAQVVDPTSPIKGMLLTQTYGFAIDKDEFSKDTPLELPSVGDELQTYIGFPCAIGTDVLKFWEVHDSTRNLSSSMLPPTFQRAGTFCWHPALLPSVLSSVTNNSARITWNHSPTSSGKMAFSIDVHRQLYVNLLSIAKFLYAKDT